MADEEEIIDDENEQPEASLPEEPPKYEDMVIEEPERPVSLAMLEVPKDEGGDGGDDVVTRTDLQAAMKAITPKFKDKRMNEILQPLMVSDIFPDQYLDLFWVTATMLMEEHECDNEIDFLGIFTSVHTALSKAYQKKHVFDILEIAGVAHEEELERLSKEVLGA